MIDLSNKTISNLFFKQIKRVTLSSKTANKRFCPMCFNTLFTKEDKYGVVRCVKCGYGATIKTLPQKKDIK